MKSAGKKNTSLPVEGMTIKWLHSEILSVSVIFMILHIKASPRRLITKSQEIEM